MQITALCLQGVVVLQGTTNGQKLVAAIPGRQDGQGTRSRISNGTSGVSWCDLTMRLSDAGFRRRRTKLIYPDHRPPPWLTEDAPRDRSNRLLGAGPASHCQSKLAGANSGLAETAHAMVRNFRCSPGFGRIVS